MYTKAPNQKFISNIASSGSRLSSRTDVGTDFVQKIIRREANEAVEYLKKREAFWEMLEIRKDKEAHNQSVESYRWLM